MKILTFETYLQRTHVCCCSSPGACRRPAAAAIVRIIVFVFYEAQHSKGYEGAQAGRTEKYEGSHNAYSRKAADAPTYSMFGC